MSYATLKLYNSGGNSAYFVKSTSVYRVNTWQVCYRHIVDVHEG